MRTTRPDGTEVRTARVCARDGCGRPVFRSFFLCWVHQREFQDAHRARLRAETSTAATTGRGHVKGKS